MSSKLSPSRNDLENEQTDFLLKEPGIVKAIQWQIYLRVQRALAFDTSRLYVGLYYALLLLHFIGLSHFAIYGTYCFFTQLSTTNRCQNFTLFNYPKHMEVGWQVTSILNCAICIATALKLYQFPRESSLTNLVKIPRFLSLLSLLVGTISYEVTLVAHEASRIVLCIEIGFIVLNCFTFALMCIWNFISEIKMKTRHIYGFRWAYKMTLFVYFLEQLAMSGLMAGHMTHRITGVYDYISKSTTIKVLAHSEYAMVCSLHFGLLCFFWKKMFYDNENMLGKPADGKISRVWRA